MPRKLIVQTFLTLDGVMQAPGGPEEDRSGDFPYGGWSVNYWDQTMGEVMGAATSTPFAMVLGRRTYDTMAAVWPHAGEEDGAPIFNNATKYLASRTPHALPWQNSIQMDGDAATALAALKQDDGPELQIHGSATLIQSVLPHGLVDEFRLWIFPVVLGKGKRLFGDGAIPAGLALVNQVVSGTGVVMATYVPAGEIPFGTVAHGDATDTTAS
ncbi:MAG: dihydrofolate reductase family protein [Thermomicrobiales bacterium]